jgi:hypothetical protein
MWMGWAVRVVIRVIIVHCFFIATTIGTFSGFAIIQPLTKHIDGFVQMMNGHLIRCPTQATGQTARSLSEIHFAFHHIFIGTKRTLEPFRQRRSLLRLHLT